MTAAEPYAALAGYRLPGATVELGPHTAWLWSHSILAEPVAGEAEPTVGWLLAMQGLGLPLDDLFALVDADARTGVVLGEAELEFGPPLRVGERYHATATIVDVVRKTGVRAGTFDRLRLRIVLHDLEDVPVFTLVNHLVFPRADR
ncbi:MAG: hypothetical protein AB7G37_08565 [Solirubrobacteraceae bacterium]